MQIGILPYAGVDIMTFELLKEYLLERYDGMPPPWSILGAGMTSSSIAQFASYPLALVRTRMQASVPCPFQDLIPCRVPSTTAPTVPMPLPRSGVLPFWCCATGLEEFEHSSLRCPV